MKTIIISESQARMLQENMKMINEEVTFYAFMSHVKDYLKQLLTNPIGAQPDAFLKSNGLDGEKLLSKLLDKDIIVKKSKIVSEGKDRFEISYKLPRNNFERKMRRLYAELFDDDSKKVNEENINEDGVGAVSGPAGATTCDASSGAFIQPMSSNMIKRNIYGMGGKTEKKESNEVNEEAVMDTAIGDFGFDAPPFKKKKKDPAYDHKNMMKKSFRRK